MTNNYLNNKKPCYKKYINYKKHIIFWIVVLFIAPVSWSGDNKTLLVYSSGPNDRWEFQGELTYDNSRAQTTILALTKATVPYFISLRKDFFCTSLEVDSEQIFPAMAEGDYEFQTLLEQLEALSACGPGYAGTYRMKTTESTPGSDDPMLSGSFSCSSDPDKLISFNFSREEQRFIERLMEVIFTVLPIRDAAHQIKIPAINSLTGINPEREINDDSTTRQRQYGDPATHTVYIAYESKGKHAVGFKVAASDQKQWLLIRNSYKKWFEDQDPQHKFSPSISAYQTISNLRDMKKNTRSMDDMLTQSTSSRAITAPINIPVGRSLTGRQPPVPSPRGSKGRSVDTPLPPIPAQGKTNYSYSDSASYPGPTYCPTPPACSTSPGASSPGTGSTAETSPFMSFLRLTSIPDDSKSNDHTSGHYPISDHLTPAGNRDIYQPLLGQNAPSEYTALTLDTTHTPVTIPYSFNGSGAPDCFSEIEKKTFTTLYKTLVSTEMKGTTTHEIGLYTLKLTGNGQGGVSITNMYRK